MIARPSDAAGLTAIPEELTELPQWVVWRLEEVPNKLKPTKVPYWSKQPDKKAASTRRGEWSTFEEAVEVSEDPANKLNGIGFVFSKDDPYAGIDFDAKIAEDGTLDPTTWGWIQRFGSYAEISPSGTGVKVIVKAVHPGGRSKETAAGIEMYDHARFFTITGHHLEGTPLSIADRHEEFLALHTETFSARSKPPPGSNGSQPPSLLELDDQTLLTFAGDAKNGSKFEQLLRGDWTGAGYPSQSEADMAFCCQLAFWTGPDAGRMDCLFRESGLMRAKWDEPRGSGTYGEKTIQNAIEKTVDFYKPARDYKGGKGWDEGTIRAPIPRRTSSGSTDETDAQSPEAEAEPSSWEFNRTDVGNSELFAERHKNLLRYDHARKRWLVWASHWWTPDADGAVYRLAKNTARYRLHGSAKLDDDEQRKAEAKWGLQSEQRQRVEAMVYLAQSDTLLADEGTGWDVDPWLIGVENGVVDLRTGDLREGRREDRITMHIPLGYDPTAEAPRWEQFLWEVFEDQEVLDFVHRAAGYSLTGDVSEECLFILHGQGSNGKSKLLKGLECAFGPYAHTTSFNTLKASSRDQVPQDVADLVGRRLVAAFETDEGVRLNEGRIKSLTGQDTISARRLYEGFFTFQSVSKFWLGVNHKPRISDDTYGFWRRVRLIPFLKQFKRRDEDPESGGLEPDLQLQAKLTAEAPGILAWAVRGAMAWQQEGLKPPAQIRNATSVYRAESDPLADFTGERCVIGPHFTVRAGELYKAYLAYSDDQGTPPRERLGSRTFGERVGAKWVKMKTKKGMAYRGIGLLAPGNSPAENLEKVQGEGWCIDIAESPSYEILHGEVLGNTMHHPSPCTFSTPVAREGDTGVVTEPPTVAYEMITTAALLPGVLEVLAGAPILGLDTETTGRNPRSDRLRLLSLSTGDRTFLLDCFRMDPAPLFPLLAKKVLVGHHLKFDLGFLRTLGFEAGIVEDTFLLSQLLHAGAYSPRGFHSLGEVVERHLGFALAKEHQKSDWSGDLSREQLQYAATDAAVLLPLLERLREAISAAGLEQVAGIECRCVPALEWMGSTGAPFNLVAWKALAEDATTEAGVLLDQLNAAAPAKPDLALPGFETAWDWNSSAQIKQVFQEVGLVLSDTNEATLAGLDHPLAQLFLAYRGVQKKMGTYGAQWERYVEQGRIHAEWDQLGAASGRMACREPNLQNLPRDSRYRACIAAPAGRKLVKADYSQVELRIAARLTGEKAMITAYERGEDLHVLTAMRLTGKTEAAAVTKAERQIAKSANFGLLFGMGAPAYRDYAKQTYGVALTNQEAEQYRSAFFTTYPGLKRWHRYQGRESDPTDTRTLTGRRRLNVSRFTEKLNTPVQGSGADGLKRALALLWERRRECPGAIPILAVHDEIVVECDEGDAEAAAEWLKRAMVDGMGPLIAPVPIEVETTIGTTWAGGDPLERSTE